ncbi:UvrD-helicase domain-containing protein [uncultured Methanobacterium sp.]|uniref:UvrD-helicase domain-containing protein n=1 Tax=uncultured Methanobacterium sp. TaxID=176306 RepID=UPI002AA82FB7|nr:UvrD-helicase domain-containing protein [uncultured Methanobacterium sp.]
MDRLIPSWDEIKKSSEYLSEGESTFLHFLDDNLPDYWKIYWHPFYNGSYPDIVLLNPEGGLMIYKVIDEDPDNSTPEANKKQLDYYRNKLIQELVPEISEQLDEDQRRFVIFKTGLYLHSMESYPAQVLYEEYPYLSVVGYDDLDEDSLYLIVPGYDFRKDRFMNPEWAEKLEKWLNPPYHRDRRTGIEFTPQQKQLTIPKPGHRRLRGAAGSGKTLVLAHRAAKLAAQNKKVLIITYNRNLWYFIKEMINDSPYNFNWSNITFRHFHGFCRDLLNELSLTTPSRFDDIVQVLEEEMKKILEDPIMTEILEKFRYDAILIDEGQDYSWEWYDFLSKFLNHRNELFLVCDEKQNIYGRELSWIDGKMENVQFRGRWSELNTIHRLPREISQLANKFSKEYGLTSSVEFDPEQTVLFNESSSFFKWENIKVKDWLVNVHEAYKTFNNQMIDSEKMFKPSEIVILLPKNHMGTELVEFFENYDISCDHVFLTRNGSRWRNKKISSITDERLKISTIHQFKGWESPNVILLIPDRWNGGHKNLDSVVYTAMTRTLKNLIVLNCNDRYRGFGNDLKISH